MTLFVEAEQPGFPTYASSRLGAFSLAFTAARVSLLASSARGYPGSHRWTSARTLAPQCGAGCFSYVGKHHIRETGPRSALRTTPRQSNSHRLPACVSRSRRSPRYEPDDRQTGLEIESVEPLTDPHEEPEYSAVLWLRHDTRSPSIAGGIAFLMSAQRKSPSGGDIP